MKGDIQNLPIETLQMFFEMLAQKDIPKLKRYLDMQEYKEYHLFIQDIINDLTNITKQELPQNSDKNDLVNLYKRLEDALTTLNKKGIDADLKFITKEINNIKLQLTKL